MKIFFLSILISLSSFQLEVELCDQLKFDLGITNTSGGLDNGRIEVTILKSSSEVKAFLYGDRKSKNRLDVNIDKLDNLNSGTYVLVLQNKDCAVVKEDIYIK